MNNRNDWHTISAEETARAFDVNPYRGLSRKEAKRRGGKAGKNHIWYVRRMEVGNYLLRTAGDMSTLLLLIIAVLAFLFEERSNAHILCVILALGAVLRIVTYIKAKRILEDNAQENIPSAALLREGKVILTSAAAIVPGDVVILRTGDTVPCDGRILPDGEVQVTERGITENRDPVSKFDTVITAGPGSSEIPCESRPNILYAGSVVLRGNLRMVATATGEHTLIGRKQGGIEIPAGEDLPILRRLNDRCRLSELFMLAFVLAVSALSLLMGKGLEQVFFCALALAAASMSEYMTAIGCIIIAIAARDRRGERGRESGAVIKDCTRLETIARGDRIILGDISLLKSGEIDFNTFFLGGKVRKKDTLAAHGEQMQTLLTLAAEASGIRSEATALSSGSSADPPPRTDREVTVNRAIAMLRQQTGLRLLPQNPVADRLPASAAMTGGIDTAIVQPIPHGTAPAEDSAYVVALSDVRRILLCCATYMTENGPRPLTDEVRRVIFTETARLEFVGAKVLAVAKRPSPYLTLSKAATLLTGMCFFGFFSLSEKPAPGAADLIKEIKAAGMPLILLSENPDHDLYYGHELGLFNKRTVILPPGDSTTVVPENTQSVIVTVPPCIAGSTPSELAASMARYEAVRRFGGERAILITKEAVDARAMGEVGCGIAVSRSGARVIPQSLKRKAQIPVYPKGEENYGGFTEGMGAVKDARRALINIANATAYLGASQFARLTVMLLSLLTEQFTGTPMPTPAAILIGGLLFDFGAVLVMAFEKAPANVLSVPCAPLPSLRQQAKQMLLAGLAAGVLSVAMPLLANGAAPLLHLHSLRDGETLTLLAASMFLVQAALSIQFMKRTPLLKRGTTFDRATICYLAGVAVFTTVMLFVKQIATLIGGSAMPWYATPLALVPGVVMFFALEWKKKG